MSQQTDFCILGAGLAGLSLADALAEKDYDVTVIDKNEIAAGASGTPGGLVNPATGRRAKKSWKAEKCYKAITRNLEKVRRASGADFYRNEGLLRPALLEKMARKMKAQYDKTSWPDGWCRWKSEEEIKDIHPGIECVDGGLWLPIGLAVDVGGFLREYSTYLQERGIEVLVNKTPQVIQNDRKWRIELPDRVISAEHLIYATGRATLDTEYWEWLPLNLIKGQVARFKSGRGLSFEHSISSLGYIARIGEPGTFVQGSTYEHDFDHLNPDAEGEAYLRKRLRRTLPELEKEVDTVEQWAGVRTSTPDYKPILGRHPQYDTLHVFTGLGSKGLLYSAFLANHYAEYLTGRAELYPEMGIDRFIDN